MQFLPWARGSDDSACWRITSELLMLQIVPFSLLLCRAVSCRVVFYRIVPFQDVPGGPVLKESRYTRAGTEMSVCDGSPAGGLGLSTCYDLRFPEMYTCLAKSSQVGLELSVFGFPRRHTHYHLSLSSSSTWNRTKCLKLFP